MVSYSVLELVLCRLKRPDIILISFTKRQIRDVTTKLEEKAKRVRLKVSTEKKNVRRINARN